MDKTHRNKTEWEVFNEPASSAVDGAYDAMPMYRIWNINNKFGHLRDTY